MKKILLFLLLGSLIFCGESKDKDSTTQFFIPEPNLKSNPIIILSEEEKIEKKIY